MERERQAPDLLPPRPRNPSVKRRRSTDGVRSRVLLRTGSGGIPEGGPEGSALNVAASALGVSGPPGVSSTRPLSTHSGRVVPGTQPAFRFRESQHLLCALVSLVADPGYRVRPNSLSAPPFLSRYRVANQPGSFSSCALRPGKYKP